ncbi:MAG TPA: FAD-dependent oxidoreductase [Cytophagaceae bacterium]
MKKKSLWIDKAGTALSLPTFKGVEEADVVIIGAGITGLTSAYLLAKAGKKVMVLEALSIGAGTTGNSSCHLTTDIDEEYRNIYKSFDKTTIRLVAESRLKAIGLIEQISKEHSIECDFRRLPGYLYTEIPENVQDIKEEADYALEAGLSVSLVDDVPLPFKAVKALRFDGQAEFNVQKYLHGLAKVCQSLGCRIFENSRVVNLEEKDDYVLVNTRNGQVKTPIAIEATHLPIFFNVLQALSSPYRSYMIVAKINGEYPDGLFWDDVDPYHYTRTYRTQEGSFLVVGGADHKTGHETNTEINYERLEQYIRSRYDVLSIEYKWSSQYYKPSDGLPYIGRSPFSRRVLVGTGYSGDGLVYGTVAAIIHRDIINNVENPWLKIYDATRFTPAASVFDFIKENTDVIKHFIKDRLEIVSMDPDELRPGEGRIIKINGQKYAVSKDENNEVNIVNAVCPHMGCIVQWNSSEKSWDCPCHGSRFENNGNVITGPAVSNLAVQKPEKKLG